MPDLAGFDVIGELHIETIVDLINLMPFTNPVDGKSIYLFGGPFSTDLDMDLGPLGVTTVRVIVDIKLAPVVHQSLALLVSSLNGSTSIAGRSLSHIGGQVTVSVPLGFAATPSGAPGSPQVPVLVLGAVSPAIVLDATTRSQADAMLGQGGADRLTSGLRGAIAALFAAAGTKAIPAMGFTIVPGIDSDDPRQLSGTPTVAWIDATTLGVFGYYKASAGGGNVSAKQTGDLAQSHEEFFYNQPGIVSVVPGRRAALLLSSDAFRLVVACPTVRTKVARSLVEIREKDTWIARIRDRDGAAVLREATNAGLVRHLEEELAKDPNLTAAFARAQADVQADADAIIRNDALSEEDAWLDETSEGQQAVTDAVPPPCGSGSVQLARQSVPHAQSDLVATLRRFEIRLGKGLITVHYDADAFLEVIVGDASAIVGGDIEIFITVSSEGFVGVRTDVKPLAIKITGTGLTGDLIELLFTDAVWGAIQAYVGLVLQKTLRDTVPDLLLIRPDLRKAPLPTRLVDIAIDPESLLMIGLFGRQPHSNEFNPALLVEASVERIQTDEPAILGGIKFPATEWGCNAAEFKTVRTFWNTTVSVRGRLQDAPLPITVLGWEVQVGNFSATELGGAHILDPRPVWSGDPAAIRVGNLTLSGTVNHPDPPLVVITGPSALGHLTRHNDISVDVTGDPDKGWKLGFRGTDGNFYIRFSLDIVDGSGTQRHGETFVAVQGDQLELPPEYMQYKSDCDAKYALWFRLKLAGLAGLVALAQVRPGEPVMSGNTREAIAVQTLVAAGSPAALRQLIAATQQFGPGVINQVGQVAALPVERGSQQALRA